METNNTHKIESDTHTLYLTPEVSIGSRKTSLITDFQKNIGLGAKVESQEIYPGSRLFISGNIGLQEGSIRITTINESTAPEKIIHTHTDQYITLPSKNIPNTSPTQDKLLTRGLNSEIFLGFNAKITEKISAEIGYGIKYFKSFKNTQTVFSDSYGLVDLNHEISTGIMIRGKFKWNDVLSLTLGVTPSVGKRSGTDTHRSVTENAVLGVNLAGGLTFDVSEFLNQRRDEVGIL